MSFQMPRLHLFFPICTLSGIFGILHVSLLSSLLNNVVYVISCTKPNCKSIHWGSFRPRRLRDRFGDHLVCTM